MNSVRVVAEDVFQLSLSWGMAYLLRGPEGCAFVDTGQRQDRPRLREALKYLGVADEQVRAVYLTHAHCDHAGNAAWLAGLGASVFTHRREARFLEPPLQAYGPVGWKRLMRPFTSAAFALGERLYPVERCAVDVRLEDQDVVQSPIGPLRVVETPGHTPGHISYLRDADGLLFSGDAVLNIIPFKRVTALSLPVRLFSDDWPETLRSARRVADLEPSLLLAGHGEPLGEDTAARLKAWADTLFP